jgi:hypothetical protein
VGDAEGGVKCGVKRLQALPEQMNQFHFFCHGCGSYELNAV